MALLPERNQAPLTARKKTGPRSIESPVQPVVEFKTSSVPELPKYEQKLKPWQSAPNTSMEFISCCSSHKECTTYGDCVDKAFHVNYAKVCSLYKHLKRKGGI